MVDFGVKLYFTPQFRTSVGKVHKLTWKKPYFTSQSRALGGKVHLNQLRTDGGRGGDFRVTVFFVWNLTQWAAK